MQWKPQQAISSPEASSLGSTKEPSRTSDLPLPLTVTPASLSPAVSKVPIPSPLLPGCHLGLRDRNTSSPLTPSSFLPFLGSFSQISYYKKASHYK